MADDFCKDFALYRENIPLPKKCSRIDDVGIVGMYSGIFNNPFLIWGKYKRHLLKTTLTVSCQFHHTQMDGAHASRFLEGVQKEIDNLRI